MSLYYFEIHNNPRKDKFWFNVKKRMTGKVVTVSDPYHTLEACTREANRVVKEKEERDLQDERDYMKSLLDV